MPNDQKNILKIENPYDEIGFMAGEFTFVQPNGLRVRAPLEFWVASILTVLTDAQRAEVLKRVEFIRANNIEVKSTEGFPLRVSHI